MSTIIKRLMWALPLVLVGWIAVMALVMRFSDAAPAADLYASGAWLVLPAGLTGCLPLTQELRKKL